MAKIKTSKKSMLNQHGIVIKKCCASCQHKTVENDGTRICQLMQLKVQQKFKCQKWQPAESFSQAGSSKGKVKRREYLMFVFEIRMQGCDDTLDSLRQRFELETGLSPFVIH